MPSHMFTAARIPWHRTGHYALTSALLMPQNQQNCTYDTHHAQGNYVQHTANYTISWRFLIKSNMHSVGLDTTWREIRQSQMVSDVTPWRYLCIQTWLRPRCTLATHVCGGFQNCTAQAREHMEQDWFLTQNMKYEMFNAIHIHVVYSR